MGIIRLNLGAGDCPLPGYVNIDIGYVSFAAGLLEKMPGGAYPLSYASESVDEIRASHLLEHFPHRQTLDVLREWARALKPGGWLKIAVPDFHKIAEEYLRGDDRMTLGYVMGGQVNEDDFHKTIFDRQMLEADMIEVGLTDIQEWSSEIGDCAALPISLNLKGHKTTGVEQAQETESITREDAYDTVYAVSERMRDLVRGGNIYSSHQWQSNIDDCAAMLSAINLTGCEPERNEKTDEEEERATQAREIEIAIPEGTVRAVLSAPRLGFLDNMFCAMTALTPLGISLEKRGGVFWGQSLSQGMENHLNDGTKYILTMDYDTVFTAQDVAMLWWLMETHPEADALCPIQARREREQMLFTVDSRGEQKDEEITLTLAELQQDLLPIRTGHFGLTMIRVSALRDLPRPWFHAKPDAQGGWGDGHVDDDISFWRKWHEAGRKLFMANRVVIGHLQLMVSWPSLELLVVQQYAGDYQQRGKPKGIWT